MADFSYYHAVQAPKWTPQAPPMLPPDPRRAQPLLPPGGGRSRRSRERGPRQSYSILDPEARRAHPIVTALVANAIAGPQAFSLLQALEEQEYKRGEVSRAAGEKRIGSGRELAAKFGIGEALDPEDPYRKEIQSKLGEWPPAEPAWPPGQVPDPFNRGKWISRPRRQVIAGEAEGEAGLFDVPPEGPARRIPVETPRPSPGLRPPTLKPKPAAAARGGAARLVKDEFGNYVWVRPPPLVPSHEPTGAGRAVTALGPEGEPLKAQPPAALLGIQQQLDSTERLLDQMEANYRAGPTGGFRRALGTASANILGGETGAKLGLSGIAGRIDPHAVVHERDREAAATTLAFPLTGSRRSVEGARLSLLKVIPHYSDPPDVWDVFSRQMRDLIANARRMPWDSEPQRTQEDYAARLDRMVAAVGALGGGLVGGAEKGAIRRPGSIKRSQINALSPQDAVDTERDARDRGITIIEDQ